jgi:hypothetical protein
LAAVSGFTNGSGGPANWLFNGSFETWSPTGGPSALPTSWHVKTGVLGTTILQSSSVFYDGIYSLEFLGDGAEHTCMYQQFSTQSGNFDTNSKVYPNNLFIVNMFVSVSSAPAAGVLRVALSDGTNPINDNSGAPDSFTVNLTTLTTSWIPVSGVFRTPNDLPAIVELELKLTTALSNGVSLYMDRIAFVQPSQMYKGGPFISIFSGNINMIQGDSMTFTISNNYGGGFQTLFNKLFAMRNLGLILPSSTTPTISDSLIA